MNAIVIDAGVVGAANPRKPGTTPVALHFIHPSECRRGLRRYARIPVDQIIEKPLALPSRKAAHGRPRPLDERHVILESFAEDCSPASCRPTECAGLGRIFLPSKKKVRRAIGASGKYGA